MSTARLYSLTCYTFTVRSHSNSTDPTSGWYKGVHPAPRPWVHKLTKIVVMMNKLHASIKIVCKMYRLTHTLSFPTHCYSWQLTLQATGLSIIKLTYKLAAVIRLHITECEFFCGQWLAQLVRITLHSSA